MSVTNIDVGFAESKLKSFSFFLTLMIIPEFIFLCSSFIFLFCLYISFSNLSSSFQRMSPLCPSILHSNSTLSKVESLIRPFLYGSPCRFYLSGIPKPFLCLCYLKFHELCEAFSELGGPSIILKS